jgi:hypothetical protein
MLKFNKRRYIAKGVFWATLVFATNFEGARQAAIECGYEPGSAKYHTFLVCAFVWIVLTWPISVVKTIIVMLAQKFK